MNNLSNNQLQILKLIAEYGGHKEVAKVMGISRMAVKQTMCRVRKNMEVETTQQAIYKATKEGWI